ISWSSDSLKSPLATQRWLVMTITRKPASRSRRIASATPGRILKSCHRVMYPSPGALPLITPSRSRNTALFIVCSYAENNPSRPTRHYPPFLPLRLHYAHYKKVSCVGISCGYDYRAFHAWVRTANYSQPVVRELQLPAHVINITDAYSTRPNIRIKRAEIARIGGDVMSRLSNYEVRRTVAVKRHKFYNVLPSLNIRLEPS